MKTLKLKFPLLLIALTLLIVCTVIAYPTLTNRAKTYYDLSGNPIALKNKKNQWTLINYWATWCDACYEEVPDLNRFYAEQTSYNAQLIGVNYDQLKTESLETLTKKMGVHFPTLKTDPKDSLNLAEIQGLPMTFIFDPQGHLKKTLYGKQTQAKIIKTLTTLQK